MIAALHFLFALALAPAVMGLITRTKAFYAGRRGQPLLQPYFDIYKLLGKGAVYSRTTTWIFQVGPIVALAALLVAAALVPWGGSPSLLGFDGDLVAFAGLLALARIAYVLAALDTGSSFEGMGASRALTIGALVEPALFLCLAALARQTHTLSLSAAFGALSATAWGHAFPALLLVLVALAVVFLAENGRIPVDDPTTHLELTMIHEVMVLDHSGPDLAFIHYAQALSIWVIGSLAVNLVVPIFGAQGLRADAVFLGGIFVLAIATGIVESVSARLSLPRIPKFLSAAGVLAALALVLVPR